ncbi:MAG TPA: single-stranded DNA-binding protein [Cytophagales bacterium]|nr:single-stranded DNA-binding protein [Cytophagales bacterium]
MAKGTVNKVILVGRLGADPDMRYAATGTAIANLSVATVDSVKNGDKWEDRTEWNRVVAFAKQAEFCGQYLTKGKSVYVEGSLRTRQWEDSSGVKKYTTEIIAREIQIVGNGGGSKEAWESAKSEPPKSSGKPKQQDGFFEPPEDDDIPF